MIAQSGGVTLEYLSGVNPVPTTHIDFAADFHRLLMSTSAKLSDTHTQGQGVVNNTSNISGRMEDNTVSGSSDG